VKSDGIFDYCKILVVWFGVRVRKLAPAFYILAPIRAQSHSSPLVHVMLKERPCSARRDDGQITVIIYGFIYSSLVQEAWSEMISLGRQLCKNWPANTLICKALSLSHRLVFSWQNRSRTDRMLLPILDTMLPDHQEQARGRQRSGNKYKRSSPKCVH
jgi:hypothetical protein